MSGATTARRGAAAELGRFLEIQTLGLNLPFALAFLLAATDGRPRLVPFLLLVVAFVAARNAGQSFNRWADLRYDRRNPRTQDRALVTGRYAPRTALLVVAANSAVLVLASYFLNLLALALAPVALAIVLGYSYTKRYSALTTVFLGFVQAITPAAVFVAMTDALPLGVLWAVGGMLAWGTAFEIVHSLGDLDSDRELGLRSLPLAIGVRPSVVLVPVLQTLALLLLGGFGAAAHLGPAYFAFLAAIAVLAVPPNLALARHPRRVAFPFRWNMLLGVVYLGGVVVATYVPGI